MNPNRSLPGSVCAAAFTLTDLLMALAVVAVVGAVSCLALKHSRQSARLAVCTDNLQKIGQAVLRFAHEHNESLPGPVADQPGELQWWYKEQVKSYAGITGPAAAGDSGFACPDDRGYTDSRPFCQSPRFDFGSYVFNGVPLPGAPNIAGWQLPAITQPKRTLLVMEWTAHAPLSWHRSLTGKENGPFYNNAESVVAFVDGHVNFTKIYHDGHTPAYLRDPIPGYEYQYRGN